MPQFNFTTYSSQIFWLLLCFGVFFTYIKFYFLPKLENVLIKRNNDLSIMQKEIEQNNMQAQDNLKNAEENIKKTLKLGDTIIAEAEAQARIHENEVIAEARQMQQSAIEDILAKQRNVLSGPEFENAIKESAIIVLKNIGMQVDEKHLEEILTKVRSK